MYEIERRFIVKKLSEKFKFPLSSPRFYIRQGYFEVPVTGNSFRVRITDNKEAELTIKGGKGIKRSEKPHPISVDFADDLIKLCSHRITKVRYKIGRWEIDFFEAPLSGLIIAEIELKDEKEKFNIPSWIEEAKEVTDSLTNHHLARLASEIENSGVPALPFVYYRGLSSFPTIVVTGGPCSGKSEIMKLLSCTRPDLQCVPEVATIVINQLNIKPRKELNSYFQTLVHNTQSLFEATSLQYAVIEGKLGLVLDRGLPDGAAYFDGSVAEYEAVLRTNLEYEYSRYKLVICLDVAPKDIYKLKKKNNSARSENYMTACMLGEKVRKVWKNHPNFVFITNNGGWDEKVRKVKEAIDKVLR